MRTSHVLPILAAAIAMLCPPAFAAPASRSPATIAEMPVYPGSAPDAFGRDRAREEIGNGNAPPPVESAYYLSGDSVEQIFAFYRDRLDATRIDEGNIRVARKPGEALSPAWRFYAFDGPDFASGHDAEGRVTYDGNWIKKALAEKRKLVDGAYLKRATFQWSYIDPASRPQMLSIEIVDQSFDSFRGEDGRPDALPKGKQLYRQRTAIAFVREALPSQADAEAERNARDEAGSNAIRSQASAMAANPPSAAELGVPLYPGAAFNPQASAGMSMGGDMRMWIFSTDDDPAKVIAFYEKATGKKRTSLGKSLRIVIEGEGFFPKRFVSVEPNKGLKDSGKYLIEVGRSTKD